MYLVYEEHIARLQRGEDAREVAGLVEHGAAGYLEAHAQLVGYDVAQSGLAEAGRAVQQRVVKRFATVLGRLHEHLKVLHHLGLAAEVAEPQRTQRVLEVFLRRALTFLPYVEIIFHQFVVYVIYVQTYKKIL